MSEDVEETEDEPPKKSKLPLILGLVLALFGAGGGFYATWSGLLLGGESADTEIKEGPAAETALPDFSYVEIDPLVISLRPPSAAQHLRFRASLEVPAEAQSEVEKLLPRVVDVLNSYLRALEPGELEDPAALTRLRAQMLRRIQVLTGLNKVNDLLIMEFVLT